MQARHRCLQTAQTLPDEALGPTNSTGCPPVENARRSRFGGTSRSVCALRIHRRIAGHGQVELVGRRLRVCPCDSEIPVGVAGVGRRHSHAGDAFDIGDRCVTDPVGPTPSSAAHARCWMRRANPSNHLSLRWPPSCRCRTRLQPCAVVRCGRRGGHQVCRDRDPALLGVLLDEANCSRRRCQIVVAEPDRSLPSTARLSEEPEDEVVEFRIPRVGEKGEVGLFELVGAECSATRRWTFRGGQLRWQGCDEEAAVDCVAKAARVARTMASGADTVAGLGVASGLGTGAARPAGDIGGPTAAASSSPAHRMTRVE